MSADVRAAALGGSNGADPERGATQALASALERIAAFHGDLARTHQGIAAAYDDLRREAENGLAVMADQSVHASAMPEPPEPRPELLTQAEVADLLRCDARTVRRMELDGEIPPPVGVGRLKRWRARDIDALVEGGA